MAKARLRHENRYALYDRFHGGVARMVDHGPGTPQCCPKVCVIVGPVVTFRHPDFYVLKILFVERYLVAWMRSDQDRTCGIFPYVRYLLFDPVLHLGHATPLFRRVMLSTNHDQFSRWFPWSECEIEQRPSLVIEFLIGEISITVDTVDPYLETFISSQSSHFKDHYWFTL